MWGGVSIKTASSVSPISVSDLKGRLRVDAGDDDALIQALLDGAVDMIDGPNGIGYAMMQQTWQKSMGGFPSTILLPGFPVKSVVSVKYIDTDGIEQTLATSAYRVDILREPVRIDPAFGINWPSTRTVSGAVTVDYDLGETNVAVVNRALVTAVSMIVGNHYENREAVAQGQVSVIPMGAADIMNRTSRRTSVV